MAKVKSDPQFAASGTAERVLMRGYAAARDWPVLTIENNRETVGGEGRPTVRRFLTALYSDAGAAHGTWSHLSAVTHASYHGLIQSVSHSEFAPGGIIQSRASSIATRLTLAAGVVATATTRFMTYMGWSADSVEAALQRPLADIQARAASLDS